MELLYAVLLVVAAVALWALNVAGLPGNWLVLALAVSFAYVIPSDRRIDLGSGVLISLFVLAAVGECIEFLAGALGATKAGGSKRGAVLAMAGSLAGGVLGLVLGVSVPVPVVGSVVGALVFASLGALAGAVLGEQWKGRDIDASLRVGQAAFWARLFGTVGKIAVGVAMIMLLVAALLF